MTIKRLAGILALGVALAGCNRTTGYVQREPDSTQPAGSQSGTLYLSASDKDGIKQAYLIERQTGRKIDISKKISANPMSLYTSEDFINSRLNSPNKIDRKYNYDLVVIDKKGNETLIREK